MMSVVKNGALRRGAGAVGGKLVAVALAGLTIMFAGAASARPAPNYAIVDAHSGDVLQASGLDRRVHPASLTKMMTLYLAFEALEQRKLRLNQALKTSRHAAAQPPSKLGLRVGERISVRDALRATAVSSANDAATVLAEAIAGTHSAFARRMTRKARALGMRRTSFRNAHGLTSKGHLSTAGDMAILARALWRDFPERYGMFSTKRVTIRGRRKRATNTLLGAVPGVDGIKTGYTAAAGHNLAASAVRRGRRVIVVFMGGKSRPYRDRQVRILLDRGFARLRDRIAPLYASAPRPRPERGGLGAPPRRPALEDLVASRAPVSAAAPSRRPAAARTEPVAAARSRWAVQVGAFGAERSAGEHLDRLMAMRAPGLSGGSPAVVEKRMSTRLGAAAAPKTVYRARFVGLGEAEARAACKHLRRRDLSCALVPPGGWSPAGGRG